MDILVQESSDFTQSSKEPAQNAKSQTSVYDIEVVMDGKAQKISNGEQLGVITPWKYLVRTINVHEHTLVIELVSSAEAQL